jgi:hypothetical protein
LEIGNRIWRDGDGDGIQDPGEAGINDAPVAASQTVTTEAATAITIDLGAGDPDGDPLAFAVIAGPQHGRLTGSAPRVSYLPDSGFSGDDQITFQANDGQVGSNRAVITIRVAAAPAALEEEAEPLRVSREIFLPLVVDDR